MLLRLPEESDARLMNDAPPCFFDLGLPPPEVVVYAVEPDVRDDDLDGSIGGLCKGEGDFSLSVVGDDGCTLSEFFGV